MQKFSQNKVEELKEILRLIYESSILPEEQDIEYFAKLVLYAHHKGWLWMGKENGKIVSVGIGYRIKSEEDMKMIPEESEGDIFFIPVMVSESKSKTLALKMLRQVLSKEQGIKEVKYHKRVRGGERDAA